MTVRQLYILKLEFKDYKQAEGKSTCQWAFFNDRKGFTNGLVAMFSNNNLTYCTFNTVGQKVATRPFWKMPLVTVALLWYQTPENIE